MSGALVAEGLHYRYGRRHPDVLAGLDWTIPPGSRTVLLGPAESGKSTLLSVLAQVAEPRRGRVYLADGGDVARAVGWLPQQPRGIGGLSVEEHIAYVGWLKGLRRSEALARATAQLERVGLRRQAVVRTVALNPAQFARLALAEALAYDARFLFLDEPTAAMDRPDRDRFWNVLGTVPRSLAVVVSGNDPREAARHVDAVAVLRDGKLLFRGSRAEFLALGADAPATPAERRRKDPEKRAAAAAYRAVLG